MSQSYYDTAQICKNGHVINSMAQSSPVSNAKYCSTCGEQTITVCESCNAPVRGEYHVPGVISLFSYHAPAYCYNCGNAYTWTKRGLEAASKLADEIDELTDDEKAQLKNSLPDLIKDSANTTVAENKFKKIMKKVSAEGYTAMKGILINVVSEAVKKTLFGA